MSQASHRKKRLKILVEKDFQYRFSLRICMIAGLIFSVFTGISLFFIRISYEMLIRGALIQMPETVARLRWEYKALSLSMILALVIFLVLTFFVGVVYSRSIASPVATLKRRLQEFISGQEGVRLNLKNSDELHSLEQIFNLAMETHDRRVEELRQRALKISKLIDEGKSSEAKASAQEIYRNPLQNP